MSRRIYGGDRSVTINVAMDRIKSSYGSPVDKSAMMGVAGTALKFNDSFIRAADKEDFIMGVVAKSGLAVAATVAAIFSPVLLPFLKALAADESARGNIYNVGRSVFDEGGKIGTLASASGLARVVFANPLANAIIQVFTAFGFGYLLIQGERRAWDDYE